MEVSEAAPRKLPVRPSERWADEKLAKYTVYLEKIQNVELNVRVDGEGFVKRPSRRLRIYS